MAGGGTRRAYAKDYRLFFSFLWQCGRYWHEADPDDLLDWEAWRRRDQQVGRGIGGSKWQRELAALRLVYEWAEKERHIARSPVLVHQVRLRGGGAATVADQAPRDVRSADVKWVTPRTYRLWRDIGLLGYDADGQPDPSWRGRNDGRNAAFTDLLFSSGLRLREGGCLLTLEVPDAAGGRGYYEGTVAGAVAKRRQRMFRASAAALRRVAAGRRAQVAVRTADGPLCQGCRHRPVLTCGICSKTVQCEISRATGQPWCYACQNRWARCSGCLVVAPMRGGTRQAPLCAKCLNPDPDFWDRCPACKATWLLSPRPCQRCTLDQRVRALIGDEGGRIRADLAPLHLALVEAERPDMVMAWLNRPKVREILSRIGRDSRPLTYEILDELPPGKTLDHLRSVLAAAGVLPGRDERLVKLERWIAAALAARLDPDERRMLHGYAIWHHLRRLRQRLGAARASHLQCLNVRSHITAAVNFLDWLAGNGLTLSSCTQPDLDRWAAGEVSYRDETGHFVRWAVAHRHAARLTFGTVRWEGPRGPHDGEKRWDDARRLLRDSTLKTSDRVIGLLLLLYAQNLAAISLLTVGHVHASGGEVSLQLGTAPVALPEPLAGLVLDLVATRRSSTIIIAPGTTPWLFPGRRHGQPISPDRLGQRLKQIGIRSGRDRSTALFTLAAEIPAAILARLLGIHVSVAVAWQRASAGDWMTYAADVSRRQRPGDH